MGVQQHESHTEHKHAIFVSVSIVYQNWFVVPNITDHCISIAYHNSQLISTAPFREAAGYSFAKSGQKRTFCYEQHTRDQEPELQESATAGVERQPHARAQVGVQQCESRTDHKQAELVSLSNVYQKRSISPTGAHVLSPAIRAQQRECGAQR